MIFYFLKLDKKMQMLYKVTDDGRNAQKVPVFEVRRGTVNPKIVILLFNYEYFITSPLSS